MRHKMMINEFIGRCSSNKGWRAPIRTGGLAAALITAGVWPRGGGGGQRCKGFPQRLALALGAFLDLSCFPLASPAVRATPAVPPSPPAGGLLRPGGRPGSCGCRPRAGGSLSSLSLVIAGTSVTREP